MSAIAALQSCCFCSVRSSWTADFRSNWQQSQETMLVCMLLCDKHPDTLCAACQELQSLQIIDPEAIKYVGHDVCWLHNQRYAPNALELQVSWMQCTYYAGVCACTATTCHEFTDTFGHACPKAAAICWLEFANQLDYGWQLRRTAKHGW